MNSGGGIFHAAYEGNVEVLRKLLENGANRITDVDQVRIKSKEDDDD